MFQSYGVIVDVILYIIAAIVIFIIMREGICWYFKINKQVEQNQRMLVQNDILISLIRSELVERKTKKETRDMERIIP